ncbi:KAT6A [Branchiostoma lanceolatum]|uniref:KAT6A protein n=1 Tax=Branchiostoma lanceolatum TaxID=7740 RepID=A0A8K0ETP0_BRALA|nr:KAT6A [Branchiostoma lanceolatum]
MDPAVSKPPTWLLQAIKAVQKKGLATKDRIINHVCRHHGVPRDTVQQQVESATNQGQIFRVRQARGACIYINPTDATWSRAKVELKRLKSKDLSHVSLRSRAVSSVKEEDISLDMEVWDSPTKVENYHVTASSNSLEACVAPTSTDSESAGNRADTMTTLVNQEVKTEGDPSEDFITSLILDAVDKIKFGRKKAPSREAIVDIAAKVSGLQKEVIEKGFEAALARGVLSSKNSGASYYCNPADCQVKPQTNHLFTTTPQTHSDYFHLICKAIMDMDEEGGSSLLAISRYLVHDLQVQNDFNLKARLQQAAKRGMAHGKLQKDGILYKLGAAEKNNISKCQLVCQMSGKPDMTVKQLIRDILRKMKANKQKPSEEGICKPITRDCSIAEKDLLECLDLCVDEGSILQIYKADGTVIYKLPETDVIKPVKRKSIPGEEKEPCSSGTYKKPRSDSDSPSLEEMLHKAIKRKHLLGQQTTAVGIFSTLLRMTKKVLTLGQVRSQLALCVEKGSMTKMGYGGKTLYFSVTGKQAAVQQQSSANNTSTEIPLNVEALLHDEGSVATDSNPLPKDEPVPEQGSKKYRKWLIRAIHDVKGMRQRATAERICKRVLRLHKVDPTVVQHQLASLAQDSRSTINRVIMPDGVAIYRVGKGTTSTKKQTARKSVKQKGSSRCQKSSQKADPIIANYILQAIPILKRLKITHTAEHICRQVYLNHDVDAIIIPGQLQFCVKEGIVTHIMGEDGGSYYDCSATDTTSTKALGLPASKKLPKGKVSKLSTVSKPLKQKGGRKPVLTLEGTGKPDALVKNWILEAIQKCRELRVWTSESQIIKRVQKQHGSHVDAAMISDNLARCLREGSVDKKFLRDGRESYRLNKDVRNKTSSTGPSPDPLVKAALLEAIQTNENTAATPYTDEICKKVANMLGQREQHIYEQLRLCMKEGSIAECEQSNPDPLVKATILDVIRSQDPRNRPYTEDICEEVAQLLGKDVDEIEMELQLCIKEGSIAEMEEEAYEEPPRPIVHVDPDSSVSELVVHAAQQMQDRHFTVRDVEGWIQENFSMDVAAGVDLRAKIQEAYTQCYREGTLPATALNSSTVQGHVDVDSSRQAAFVDPKATEPYPVMLVCHQSLQQDASSTEDAQATMDSRDDSQQEVESPDVPQAEMDIADNCELNAATTRIVMPTLARNDDLHGAGSSDNISTNMMGMGVNPSMPSAAKSSPVIDITDDASPIIDLTDDVLPNLTGNTVTSQTNKSSPCDDQRHGHGTTGPQPEANNSTDPQADKNSIDNAQETANNKEDPESKQVADNTVNGVPSKDSKSNKESHDLQVSMDNGLDNKTDLPPCTDSTDTSQSGTWYKDDSKSTTNPNGTQRSINKTIEDLWLSKNSLHTGKVSSENPPSSKEDILHSDRDVADDLKSEDPPSSKDSKDVLQSDTDINDDFKSEDRLSSKESQDILQSDQGVTEDFKSEDPPSSKESQDILQSDTDITDDFKSEDPSTSKDSKEDILQSDQDITDDFMSEDPQSSKEGQDILPSDTDITDDFKSEDPSTSKDSKEDILQSDQDITDDFKSEDPSTSKDSKEDILQSDQDITDDSKSEDPLSSKDSEDVLQSDTNINDDFKSEDPQSSKESQDILLSDTDMTDDFKSAPDCCDDVMTSGPPLLSPQRGVLTQVPSPKPSPPLLTPQRVLTTDHSSDHSSSPPEIDLSVCLPIQSSGIKQER